MSGKLPTVGQPRARISRRYRAFSADEMRAFFAAIPTTTEIGLRDRAIFLMYFWTARRRAEVARVVWGDIAWGALIDEQGQAAREGWLYSFQGKGHGDEDSVAELPGPAKAALDAYLIASKRLDSMRPDSPLFVAIGQGGYYTRGGPGKGEQPLSTESVARRLKHYVRQAGLDSKRLSIHSWRHTAAQQRYLVDPNVQRIRRLLQHESLATTTLYLDGLMATADPAARLLEDQFGAL